MSKALWIRSLLPLLVFICSYQISVTASANPETLVLDASAHSSRSIEGTDCSSETDKERPSQDRDNSPEPVRDIDESEGGLDDLKPANSLSNDQGTLHFSVAAPTHEPCAPRPSFRSFSFPLTALPVSASTSVSVLPQPWYNI
jgi:hypothetical protein